MAYNPENVIITWSVYTRSTMTDSRQQILSVLRTAGISDIENCIYIDLTGELRKMLYTYLREMDAKGVIYILRAIERNHVITLINNEFMRLRVGINATGIFNFEPTNLPNLLQ